MDGIGGLVRRIEESMSPGCWPVQVGTWDCHLLVWVRMGSGSFQEENGGF